MVKLTRDLIDYGPLTEGVRSASCGGVVLFLGTVRDLTAGAPTASLDYEAYPGMAEAKLAEVEAELRSRWPAGGVAIVHRLGRLEIGDVAVAVAVACPHRAEAFDACRWAIDRLKQVVPIWKKDNRPDGSSEWSHPAEGASRG